MAIPINPQVAAQSDPGLFEKWRGWLGDERNRTALLQTGLSLMQPRQLGQSQFGHIANSIGQGLGAAGRTEARLADEALDSEERARKVEGENLDREIKRSGQELDRMNAQSLIADRRAGQGIAEARLGLERDKIPLETEKTRAEIENLKQKGGLSLADIFKAQETGSLTNQTAEQVLQEAAGLQGRLGGSGQSGALQPPTSPAPSTTYPNIRTPQDYAALPSGTIFTAPDGSLRRKP